MLLQWKAAAPPKVNGLKKFSRSTEQIAYNVETMKCIHENVAEFWIHLFSFSPALYHFPYNRKCPFRFFIWMCAVEAKTFLKWNDIDPRKGSNMFGSNECKTHSILVSTVGEIAN